MGFQKLESMKSALFPIIPTESSTNRTLFDDDGEELSGHRRKRMKLDAVDPISDDVAASEPLGIAGLSSASDADEILETQKERERHMKILESRQKKMGLLLQHIQTKSNLHASFSCVC